MRYIIKLIKTIISAVIVWSVVSTTCQGDNTADIIAEQKVLIQHNLKQIQCIEALQQEVKRLQSKVGIEEEADRSRRITEEIDVIFGDIEDKDYTPLEAYELGKNIPTSYPPTKYEYMGIPGEFYQY